MNYERSEHIGELVKALVSAQSLMGAAAKDAKNPHFGSKYADLAACFDACKKVLTNNGLAILQPATADGAKVTVTTILAHISGQWISSDLTLTSDKGTPQALGSCLTYARRYGLSALIGLAADDDDGNEASGRGESQDSPARGKKAAQEVADRKVQEMKSPPAKNPKMLEAFAQMKQQLGDALYAMVLGEYSYKSADEIPDRESGDSVYKRMGVVNKIAQAAAHGELLNPGITPEIFSRLPDSSVVEVLKQYKAKLANLIGSDVASDEYEVLRGKSADMWTFVNVLEATVKKHAKSQGIAS